MCIISRFVRLVRLVECGLEDGSSLVLVATDDDGQELRVGACDNASSIVLRIDRDIVVREGVAAVINLHFMGNLRVPVEGGGRSCKSQ